MSTSIKINHPQTFDDLSPDYDIQTKLRAYRAIMNHIKDLLKAEAPTLGHLPYIHIQNAVFMLGYTLKEIGASDPYMAGSTSRKLGKKIAVAPVDENFRFKEALPTDEIEYCDFIRANTEKLRAKLSALYPPLAIFNTNPFVYFDRALQELTLCQAYMGKALYKFASKRDDYAITDSHMKNTVEEPKKFNFQAQ